MGIEHGAWSIGKIQDRLLYVLFLLATGYWLLTTYDMLST